MKIRYIVVESDAIRDSLLSIHRKDGRRGGVEGEGGRRRGKERGKGADEKVFGSRT